jgi:hypothetical protein
VADEGEETGCFCAVGDVMTMLEMMVMDDDNQMIMVVMDTIKDTMMKMRIDLRIDNRILSTCMV